MVTNMRWEFVFITKEIAESILQNNPRNRTIKQKIEKIKSDLVHGLFIPTHQGIAIAEDGELVDGQHRLTAIYETGIPAWMWVCYNAPKSTKIDKGIARTDRESLYMAGLIDKGEYAWNSLTFPLVTYIIKRNLGPSTITKITENEKLNVYDKLKEILDPVIAVASSSKKYQSAIILYAMACAFKSGISIKELKVWHKSLQTGYVDSDDPDVIKAGKGIIILRNYLNEHPRLSANTSNKNEQEMLEKVETSIYHFSKRNDVKQIKGKKWFKDIIITTNDLYE